MKQLGAKVEKWRFVILGFLLVLSVVFIISLKNVHYETDFTKFFRYQEKAVEDNRQLLQTFGGFVYIYLSITAPPNTSNYFLQPPILRTISHFEQSLERNPDIISVSSFVSYLRALNFTVQGEYAVPTQRSLILYLARMFRMFGQSESLTGLFVNDDLTRLTFRIRIFDSNRRWYLFEDDLKSLVEQVQSTAKTMLPDELSPEVWGTNIAFRSITTGLIALLPLFTGITLNFALLWILNIPFDVVTIMFSSIAVGAGVDDTIHLLIQYRKYDTLFPKERTNTPVYALTSAGRPILLTTISVICGMLVLTLSGFRPIVYFGMLISTALCATTLGALVVLLAMLGFRYVKFRKVLASKRTEPIS